MGGAVGASVANWLKSRPRERRTLIAAGAGAGLAAAFNAPLSGVIFVLEEIQRDFHPFVFGAAFLAAVIADVVARLLSGAFPVFSIPTYPTPPTSSQPVFALLGIVAGLFGVAFNRSLLGSLNWTARFNRKHRLMFAVLVGAAAGLLGWFYPIAVGGGHSVAELALAGGFTLVVIPLFFINPFFSNDLQLFNGCSRWHLCSPARVGSIVRLGTRSSCPYYVASHCA